MEDEISGEPHTLIQANDMSSIYVEFGDAHRAPPSSFSFGMPERFVALLDILGMSKWTEHEDANVIASKVEYAVLSALTQTTVGKINGISFGPLIGSAIFSDSILLYSPDTSWASFIVLCTAVRTLVAESLTNGVPLRGTISVGPMVADPKRSLYIGAPLSDAHATEQSPTKMEYRGVGVQLTTKAEAFVRKTLLSQPIPLGFSSERLDDFWNHDLVRTDLLTRHLGCVFVNHWSRRFLFPFDAKNDPMSIVSIIWKWFFKRGLPLDQTVQRKFWQTIEFHRETRLAPESVAMVQAYFEKDWMLSLQESERSDDIVRSCIEELHRLNKLLELERSR